MKATLLFLSAGLLSLASCRHDVEIGDPEGPAPPTTPYNLEVPVKFPALLPMPADNPLTNEGVQLGRHLFYETALSVDNKLSCGTCHRQELAFTDGLARSRGVGGTLGTRSAMSLANLAWEEKLTWDGGGAGLEAQARIPIENPLEMHHSVAGAAARLQATSTYPALFRQAFGSSTITEANVLKALAQFERTLVSSNSRFDQYLRGNRTALSSYELQGQLLFAVHPNPDPKVGVVARGANCGDCHAGSLQTDHSFKNNGLDLTFADNGLGLQTGLPTDNGKFRVPSLRNIALTAPYMHDGRFATLSDVLDHYNDHVELNSPNIDPLMQSNTNTIGGTKLGLTPDEKAKIIAFLQTLTDTTFTKDPRFARPK